jgi:hypothetical protein
MTVREIYDGSNGDATKAFYDRLTALGPVGTIAMNLFRAQKASARAKVYRGGIPGRGSFKGMAYDRKNWSLAQLEGALVHHAVALGIRWGWQHDSGTPGYEWVLYVELPTGQVSFHSAQRGSSQTFDGRWDGLRGASHHRIIQWCEQLLATPEVASI